ncbi:MAG: hypothetical protein F4206_01265, partial [Gammaproteobacteria bacterium]|nr:hypothetical protein [Gammaproteobacteria bacterium]
VMLVRNEEHFVAWSLMNVLEFCDHVLVMDNQSTDRTRRIVEGIADRHENVELTVVPDANDTQKFLKGWFGTRTWVLGLDGDEIHDPVGLSRLRGRLQSGAFDEYWAISGIYCHVAKLDFHQSRAFGYSSPPAKAGTKLFNFNAIENWMSRWRKHERLHGSKVFRSGYSGDSVYRFSASENDEKWDTADLRCLHLCFMPRTPAETESALAHQTRKNPVETRLLRRMARKIESIRPNRMDYRQKRYARGPVIPHDIHGFGKPDDFREFDDRCDHVMDILNGIQANTHIPRSRLHGVREVQ